MLLTDHPVPRTHAFAEVTCNVTYDLLDDVQVEFMLMGSNRSITAIVAGLLLLLAGYTIGKFVLNFDQLESVADQNNNANIAIEAGPPTESAETAAPVLAPPASTVPGAADVNSESVAPHNDTHDEKWLRPLNHYRQMVGLGPVAADARLSRGDYLHSYYLINNYGTKLPNLQLGGAAHTEDPNKPGFTPEGLAAARHSDVDWSWDPHSTPELSWAIDNWMRVPFHRLQIINPNLHRVGYGALCRAGVCIASLNTGSGAGPISEDHAAWPQPLQYPPDGATVNSGQFENEWPDPLSACADYAPPAGLPITLELGSDTVPGISSYSLRSISTGGSLTACAFDTNSYVNAEAAAQAVGRAILRQFGAIVIVPRKPLRPGRYAVSVNAGGHLYSWSFTVARRTTEVDEGE